MTTEPNGAAGSQANGLVPLTDVSDLVSAVVDRTLFAHRHGLMFGGLRDIYTAFGYTRTPVFGDYQAKYDRQGIAKRVVEAKPKATWSINPRVVDDEDPENETPFEREFNRLARRLDLFNRLQQADIQSGIGRYGALLIGLANQSDQAMDAMPVRGADDVLYLRPLNEDQARVQASEIDIGNERFGQPMLYQVRLEMPTSGGTRNESREFHHSRVIHLAEDRLGDDVYGVPRLRPVFNLLDDLLKVVGGCAETYWQAAGRLVHAKTDPKAKPLASKDREALKDQVDEVVHGRRQFLGTDGVDLNVIGASVSDPKGPFDVILSEISAAAEIPQRILLGSERGQLASEQDERAWANRIDERQKQYAEPVILRPLIDRLIELNALPAPAGGEYVVQWDSVSDPSERERAETANAFAKAASTFAKARSIVAVGEARQMLGLPADHPDPPAEPEIPEAPTPPGAEKPAEDDDDEGGEEENKK